MINSNIMGEWSDGSFKMRARLNDKLKTCITVESDDLETCVNVLAHSLEYPGPLHIVEQPKSNRNLAEKGRG